MSKIVHTPEFSMSMTKLTLKDLFFTELLYSLKIVKDDEFKSIAGTDGTSLIYNPKLFGERPLEHRIFILAHEIMHVVLFHSLRRGIRHPLLWNIAADYVVNGMLKKHSASSGSRAYEIPEDALLDEKYDGMTTEEVYDLLIKECKKSSQSESDEGNGGSGEKFGKHKLPKEWQDVKDYDPAKNNGKSAAQVERETGINVSKAAESCKAAGKTSSLIERFVGDALVQRQPWYRILAPLMNAMNSKEYNWTRPDWRRTQTFGVLSPKMQSESMGKVVIGFDWSGSVTQQQASAMAANISNILSECRPSSVEIVNFDARICGVQTFDGPFYDIKFEATGGGGTDFHPVVEYAEGVYDCQVLIILTDMYGPAPKDSSVPTIWVTSSKDTPAPFGTLIEADFND